MDFQECSKLMFIFFIAIMTYQSIRQAQHKTIEYGNKQLREHRFNNTVYYHTDKKKMMCQLQTL